MALPDRGLGTALSSILGQWTADDETSVRRAGLQALIPSKGPRHAGYPGQQSHSGHAGPGGAGGFPELASASLEVLRSLVAADLSAFVYRLDGDGYRVVGRRPAGAFDGFELLSAARGQVEAGRAFGEYAVGDVQCVAVGSVGRRSRGVVLLGRIGERLTTEEVRVAAPMCQVIGALLQAATGLA